MAFWKKEDDERKEEMEKLKKQVQGPSEGKQKQERTRLPEPPVDEGPQTSRSRPEEGVREGNSPQLTDSRQNSPSQEERSLPEPPREIPDENLFGEMEEPSQPAIPKKGSGAPLFVRVENYEEILKTMEEIKDMIGDLKELFSLMSNVDDIKREGMQGLRKGISDLADALITMDSEFVRPEGMEDVTRETSSEVFGTMQNLQNELDSIRRELDEL